MSLVDPRYSIPSDLLAIVDRSLIEKYTPSLPKTVPPRARSSVSAQIAVEAVELLLAPLRTSYEVTDMEKVRRNFPGYDFLIHQRGTVASPDPAQNHGLRVQVKGSLHPDWIGFPHGKGRTAAREYDVVILVDGGLSVTARLAHFSRYPVTTAVDLYVLPREIVHRQVDHASQGHRQLQYLSYYRPPLRPPAKDVAFNFNDLPGYRNRFDLIEMHLP
jgi:hypothetical protein